MNVYEKIKEERKKQRKRWGDTHDAGHTMSKWIQILRQELREVPVTDPSGFRNGLIKVAAVAVAAIQATNRKE